MSQAFKSSLPLVVFLVACIPLMAQQNVGAITGRITDPSGAAVPGATVDILHQQTGQRRIESITNQDGMYTFNVLQIGMYTMTVNVQGFKSSERRDIQVVSGETATVDLALEVGSLSETVSVTAELPILDTTSSQLGTTRTSEEIAKLPILLFGSSARSAMAFAKTFAGVNYEATPEAGGGTQEFMVIARSQINGAMAGTWGYQLDGVDAGTGEAESGAEFVIHVPEAIAEFRLTANADASSGFNSGVNMELTLKSGTNKLHGAAFWYNRNNFFAARNWFDRTGKSDPDRQNEGGFVLGGPVFIPKVYDGRNKTFFFTTFDIYRFHAATNVFKTVPTPLMRQGDFSEVLGLRTGTDALGAPIFRQIYDPLTTRPNPNYDATRPVSLGNTAFLRDPFPGNIIPANRFSPISLKFQNGYKLPTDPGTSNNFYGPQYELTDKDQGTIKIDHNIGARHRFSFSYETLLTAFLPAFSGNTGHSNIRGYGTYLSEEINTTNIDDRSSVRYRFNYSFTAKPTLLFGFRAGMTRNPNRVDSMRYPFSGPSWTFGREAGIKGTLSPATPIVNMEGYSNMGVANQLNLLRSQRTPFTADMIWTKGSHNIKMGVDWVALPFSVALERLSNGTFSFNDRITGLPGITGTGSGWASFLLGEVDSAQVGSPIDMRAFTGGWGFYFQDQWRVKPKLTLNYGLRYNLFTPLRESQDKITSFDPTMPNPGAGGRLGALSVYGEGPGRNGLTTVAENYYKAFAPNLGFAYQLTPKTVVRGSYGIGYVPYWQKFIGSQGPTQPTDGFSAILTAQTLDNGVTPAFNWINGFPLTMPSFPRLDPTLLNGQQIRFLDRLDNRPPMAQNIAFEVGRELSGSMSLRVGYVGNLTHRLPTNGMVDMNALDLSYLSLGSLLGFNINSPQARAAGIPIPYPGFNSSVAQALRPFPQYTNIPVVGAQVGSTTYHAAQINFQKRTGDLTFLAAYTISKQLTNVDFPGFTGLGTTVLQHPELREDAKGLLGKDKPQILSFSWAYDLPFGRGKRFLGAATGVLNQVVSEWHFSAIQHYSSGLPLRVTSRQTIPGGFGPIWPVLVPDVPLQASDCGDYNPSDPSKSRYLNPAAFRDAAPFALGNISRLSNVRRCSAFDESVRLEKAFPLHEGVRFQVGVMAQNLLNRHVLTNLVLDIGDTVRFGQYTNASKPRNFQFYLRLEF